MVFFSTAKSTIKTTLYLIYIDIYGLIKLYYRYNYKIMTAFEWINHQEDGNKIQVSETQLTPQEKQTLQEGYIKEASVIKEKSIADMWKLRRASLETNNDNGLALKKWKDDGLTFGIHGNIEFQKGKNKKFTISAWMDSYTENPEYRDQNGEWVAMRDWNGKSARVDRWYIEWLYTETKKVSDKTHLSYSAAAGLWYTGDLWWQNIQNAWHKNSLGKKTMDNPYTVHAKYENFKNPHLYAKAWVWVKHNITEQLYLKWEAQAQLSLYNQAANTMSGKVGAWFDTKYIRVEGWLEWYYHTWDQSSIVQDFYDKWKNTGMYWEIGLWSENWFQVVWKVSDRHGWQWTVWIELDF